MKTSAHLHTFFVFAASVVAGCGAAIAIASAGGADPSAPSPRPSTEIVRLEPVVVSISKSTFDAIRADTAVVRAGDAKKVTRV